MNPAALSRFQSMTTHALARESRAPRTSTDLVVAGVVVGRQESAFPTPRWIAVDVDETLVLDGHPNLPLIAQLRLAAAEGYTLLLWSMRGQEHARTAALACGVDDLFAFIISKPGIIIDDQSWRWTASTHALPVSGLWGERCARPAVAAGLGARQRDAGPIFAEGSR